jgi:hypothetical protein
VNDDLLKPNSTTTHTKLDAMELPGFTSHMDGLVVFAFVDVRRAEQYPVLGMCDWRRHGNS